MGEWFALRQCKVWQHAQNIVFQRFQYLYSLLWVMAGSFKNKQRVPIFLDSPLNHKWWTMRRCVPSMDCQVERLQSHAKTLKKLVTVVTIDYMKLMKLCQWASLDG